MCRRASNNYSHANISWTLIAYIPEQQSLVNSKKYSQPIVLHVALQWMVTADEMDITVSEHWTATDHSMVQCVCNWQSDAAASQVYNPGDV